VETSNDGILMLSEIFYPGWRATVDGVETEIFRANYNLRSVFVATGVHRVEFRFDPPSYRYGGLVTLASLLVCGAGIAVPAIRSITQRAAPPPLTET
jgi:uncharacterized membrane protein YfhO